MDPHRLSALRSLELHRDVAARCRQDAALVERARAVLERWIAMGALSPAFVARWQALFASPREDLFTALCADDEPGAELRSNSPFSVLVQPKERWALTKRFTEQSRTSA